MDELIPKSVDEAAGKLMNPTAENAGKTFGDIWYLVFGGISFAADKRRIKYQVDLEAFEKSCREKIEAIPEEKLVEPDTQTASIALEESKFCIENAELREMFSNLIASTMNSDTAEIAHPSFPQILKQLSTFDAKLFLSLRGPHNNVAICEYRVVINDNSFYKLQSNIYIDNLYEDQTDEQRITKQALSISLLERLGLVKIDYTNSLFDKSRYMRFEKTKFYRECQSHLLKNESLKIVQGILSLTDLGKQLLAVCCPVNFIHITVSDSSTKATQEGEEETMEKTGNT